MPKHSCSTLTTKKQAILRSAASSKHMVNHTNKMRSQLEEHGADQLIKLATTDLKAQKRNEFLFEFPISFIQKKIVPLLQNSQDLPIVYLFSNICMLTLPAALAIYTFAPTSNFAGGVYFVINYVLFLQRFMLGLHYSEHRILFRSGKYYWCFNQWLHLNLS